MDKTIIVVSGFICATVISTAAFLKDGDMSLAIAVSVVSLISSAVGWVVGNGRK